MTLHQAKKIVIITEKMVANTVCKTIEAAGASGYTIVAAGGKGRHSTHSTSDRASVIQEFTNVKIEAIVKDQETAETIMRRVADECFNVYSGISYIEEVQILRPSKFSESLDT
ncbi:MAG: P-II family nitrogen regulator [Akkermansiaceae bacterium]